MPNFAAEIAVAAFEFGRTGVTNPQPQLSSVPDTSVHVAEFQSEAETETDLHVSAATLTSVKFAQKSCSTVTQQILERPLWIGPPHTASS